MMLAGIQRVWVSSLPATRSTRQSAHSRCLSILHLLARRSQQPLSKGGYHLFSRVVGAGKIVRNGYRSHSTQAVEVLSSTPSAPSTATPSFDPSSQYVALQLTPKLKPRIVQRRLKRLRVYEGAEKGIRHSPWRLNLVCQLAAGMPLPTALTQLEFCKKRAAPLVQKVLRRTSNLADIRDGLQPSQLEVAECFATKGVPLKRMKIMGRGRVGRMEHKFAHMRVVLREIDFKLKVYQAPTINQKKRWLQLQQLAQRDGDRAKAERAELKRLEKETESKAKEKK